MHQHTNVAEEGEMEVPLSRIIEQAGGRHHESERLALVGESTALTYRGAAARMWRLGRALRRLGVGPGDRVAFLSGNSVDYLLLFAAVSALGAALAPLSSRWAVGEAAEAVTYLSPRVLITSPGYLATASAAVVAGSPTSLAVLDGTPGGNDGVAGYPGGVHDLSALAREEDSDPFPVADDPDAPVWLAFTGGTTGQMKACVIDAGTFSENILFCALQFGFGRGDVTLACGSYAHMLPLYFSLMQLYCVGTVVVLGEVDAPRVLRAIEQHRVSWLAAVPTIYGDLVRAQPTVRADLNSLRFVISAGSPLHTEAKRRLTETLTPNLFEHYGATETGWTTLLEPRDQHRKHRCVGQPMLGVDVEVVRPDGRPCAVDEVGLVRKRGLVLMREYFDRPESTAEVVGKGGWATAGDLGRLDAEGYLYLVDRQKDMIISGGVNVYPGEVEEVLLRVPGTEEVAVIGVPHERWGEAVHAVVALRAGTNPADWERSAQAREPYWSDAEGTI
jgi:acyl-CoA synthetase (AMP-forming)/AMP-acid ligase II